MSEEAKTSELKNLGNLSPAPGSHRSRKRIGRGPGSGWGKTAGKGHKGQKARKGGKVAPGFEGGQMPLYRRLPKRGFTSPFRIEFNVVNLDQLSQKFEDGAVVDRDALQKAGMLKSTKWPVKVLARGELTRKLTISVEKASEAAKSAVASAGGSLTETGVPGPKGPKPRKDKKKS